MHVVLQLALFAALVLVWLLLDELKRKRMTGAHARKHSGEES
jgi:hypothetical protein